MSDTDNLVIDWRDIEKCLACGLTHGGDEVEYIPVTGNLAEYFSVYFLCPTNETCVAIGKK